MMDIASDDDRLACAFCGTARSEVRYLIASADSATCICDQCVLAAVETLINRDGPDWTP